MCPSGKYPNQFKGVDVELVFYTRLKNSVYTQPVGTRVSPEIRFTLPKGTAFSSIELPPLPRPDYIYSFDIFEKGTEIYPYNSGSPLVVNGFTLKPNEGRVTSIFVDNGFNFQAGKSKLFIINDATSITTSPTRNTYVSGGRLTDLSQYFQ